MKLAGCLPLAYLIVLSGCGLNPEYREAKDAERIARYEATCEKLGFSKGSQDMNECKLRLYAQGEAARAPRSVPKSGMTCVTTGSTTTCN